MIKLGAKVRDKISGFAGVATGRAEYLYTTPTVQVSPEGLDSSGKLLGAVWFEETQLELTNGKNVVGYEAVTSPQP